MNPPLRLLLAVVSLFAAATPLAAHPVAQGAMDILIDSAGVTARARVANEQVFVADALGGAQAPAGDLGALWPRHGEYLVKHLHIRADDTPLSGAVVKVTPPENTTTEGRTSYELRYAFPPGKASPAQIVLRQDVLNEIMFAPGNPWEATYVVRIGQQGRTAEDGLLFTSKNPLVVACDWRAPTAAAAAPHLGKARLFGEYLHHGVMHILTGYDHLLFVAALVLAVATLMDLVKVVTAFTLAHTITLTLSVLDVVRLPSSIVEPIIAGSIVVVALQNVVWPERSRGWARLGIAFAFGLFHGLGYAGGLLDAMEGLPGVAVALAIIAFSIGVEIGHSAVVLPLFGALKLGRAMQHGERGPERFALGAQRIGSVAICFAGMFYLVSALR